jgi:hypothetical protein
MKSLSSWLMGGLTAAVCGVLIGCASGPAALSEPMPANLLDWSARELPGKRATNYSFVHREGRACVLARSEQSVSLWRRSLHLTPDQFDTLQFDWWISDHEPTATVADAQTDDAPARLLLGFDGDSSRLSMRNRMQFELAETLTGEAPPFATLMYVWDASAAPGTVIISTRSDRMRKIVVGSGRESARSWQRLRRNVQADYQLAFGEPAGNLVSLAMMTDSDNTRSLAEACYGNILLLNAQQQAQSGSLQF